MKKTLAILLLLSLVVGCGKNDQTSESPAQEPKAPTLADSFQGKRIHFQIKDLESERKDEFWLQLGENNQLTVNDNGRNMSMSYVINDTKLIVDADGEAVEMRFSKVKLAVGDEVLFLEHKDGDLQALLDSTDDSAAKRTAPGSITKIEAAQNLVTTEETIFPVTGKITYDGQPLADARIRLEAVAAGSRVYACDTKDDGSFEIEAFYADATKLGAPLGEYKVLIGKFQRDEPEEFEPALDDLGLEQVEEQTEAGPAVLETPARSMVNEKFNYSSTTPLMLEVKEGKNSFRIDLKSNGTGTVKAL